jgi:GNAT superfamily N-acetyltransferase
VAAAPDLAFDPRLIADCHRNVFEAFRRIARSRPRGRIEEEWGAVRVANPGAGLGINQVFLTEVPADPSIEVAKSARFMESAGVQRWTLTALPHVAKSLGTVPESRGLTERHTIPGMILPSIPVRPPTPPPDLRIRRATTAALWEQMVRVGLEGLTGTVPDDPLSRFPFQLSATARGFVGFAGGVPVATSLQMSYRGISGIYLVATLPPYRGRGFGAAMTWRAVVDGRKDGCRVSCLQASDMGYPVYSKMGFQKFGEYTEWHAP